MPTVFETASDGFYTAFFEPDTDKRKNKIEEWIKSVVPILQTEVEAELRTYLGRILENTWTTEGWQSRVKKFTDMTGMRRDKRFIDFYQLVMEIGILQNSFGRSKKVRIVNPVSNVVRDNTCQIGEQVLAQINEAEATKLKAKKESAEAIASQSNITGGGGTLRGRQRAGLSPNDQRSNTFNPNNPAHRAAANNRSNQMNPNNPAYRSSRGGGRRK